MAPKIGTTVCRTVRTVVWEVGKGESRRQMPLTSSFYLLPDLLWGDVAPGPYPHLSEKSPRE